MSVRQNILTLFTILMLCGSCDDDTFTSSVPDLKFSLEVPLISFPNLYNPGSYLVLDQYDTRFPSKRLGYRGLILLHSPYEHDTYHCFDRACPKDLTQTTAPNSIYQIECKDCGTIFDLYTGFPQNGDETGVKESLKQYSRIAVLNGKLTVAN